jgi:hypothetical protein
MKIPESISKYINKRKDGCWAWHGPRSKEGLPQGGKRTTKILTFLWKLKRGILPANRRLVHTNDCIFKNKRVCVNPNHYHIPLKTYPSMRMKGVGKGNNPNGWPKPLLGESNFKAKLKVKEVKTVRLLKQKGLSLSTIKEKLNLPISLTQLGRIASRQNWRHV